MTKLVSCFECGKSVSSEARKCPHCNTQFLHSVSCSACKVKLKHSVSIYNTESLGYDTSAGYFHKHCFDTIKNSSPETPDYNYSHPYPACNKYHQYTLTASSNYQAQSISQTCDSCGHLIQFKLEKEAPYTNCYFCRTKLNKAHSVKFTLHEKEEYAHDFCHKQPANIEQIDKIYKDIADIQYRKDKEDFWSGRNADGTSTTSPGCSVFFFLVTGGFLTSC